MVARWFHSYSRTSPGGANMALAAITTVLNWAKASGKLPKATPNPAAPIRKNRRPPRGRMLSSAQVLALRRLLMARQGESQAVDVIHLLLLTGCRFGEIAGLTWAEVLSDRLTLKDAKTGPRDVFLSKPARDILKRLKERAGVVFNVFPSRVSSTGHIVSVTSIWEQLRKRAGLPDDIRLHDLRHTFASHALLAGESLPTTGRLLGHATPRTTQRYAHLDGATLTKTADFVSNEIAKLMNAAQSSQHQANKHASKLG
jgi:integrase